MVEAVGMEAHGSPVAGAAIKVSGLLPDALAKPFIDRAAVDKMAALVTSIKSVRRGGVVSVLGVYGGEVDPMPLHGDGRPRDRHAVRPVPRPTVDRRGQVLSRDDDALGVESLPTHVLPLEEAPDAYEMFQKKKDGCVKVVLKAWGSRSGRGGRGRPGERGTW